MWRVWLLPFYSWNPQLQAGRWIAQDWPLSHSPTCTKPSLQAWGQQPALKLYLMGFFSPVPDRNPEIWTTPKSDLKLTKLYALWIKLDIIALTSEPYLRDFLCLSHTLEDWTETHLSEEVDDGSAWRDLFSSDLGAFNICAINGRLIHFTCVSSSSVLGCYFNNTCQNLSGDSVVSPPNSR